MRAGGRGGDASTTKVVVFAFVGVVVVAVAEVAADARGVDGNVGADIVGADQNGMTGTTLSSTSTSSASSCCCCSGIALGSPGSSVGASYCDVFVVPSSVSPFSPW